HPAQIGEREARHPICSVAAEADDAAGGNVGMKDRTFPSQLGHHPRIGGAETHMNLMLIANRNGLCSLGQPNASSMKTKDVEIGRSAVGREVEDRAFGGELLQSD